MADKKRTEESAKKLEIEMLRKMGIDVVLDKDEFSRVLKANKRLQKMELELNELLKFNSELYRAAEGKGFGDSEVKVYNNARGCIENYALENFGIDIKNEEIPEEAIDTFLSEHSELDRFSETGQMVAIDTAKKIEDENMRNETLADKYNRMEKLFEGKMSHLGSGNGETFNNLCKWVEEEFPEKDSEAVLLEATSRMIEENFDFDEFNYQYYDDVYGFGDGAEWRLDFSDSAAKKLISGEILTLSDAQSLIWEKAEKEFAALKENPQYKDEIEITDRINSAFRIADFLYPEFTKEIDKEKNLLADEWPQYSNEEKKTVINNAFEKIKSAFDEKKVRLSDSRTDELVFEGSDKWLLLGDFKALIKGKDAAEHGKESLSYIRPNAEQLHDGIENGWEFDEITTGYAIFQNPDLNIKGGFTPKFISKLDDMNVFKSDGDAAKQYGIDHNCRILEEKKDIWIGDEDLEYYSYPDIPENRRIMKENGWLLEQPLEFDFSEFTEKDFNRIRDELFKDNPKEDYYGRLHIGSLHVEFVINQNDGWVDTNYYILGEKGEGETQFGVPYGHFPGHQFIANLFTDNTYEEFKEKVTKAVLDDIAEEGTLKPEAMRPLVDWNDEEQVKELYRTKLVEQSRLNEDAIAPYSRERREIEAVRDFIAGLEKLPASQIADEKVFAVIDNIGKVQGLEPGDFLKIRKDGTFEHISALGSVEKEPLEILNIINSFAENHAAVSEEHSQQKKDYEEINSLYKKAYEKHMRINDNGFNPSEDVLNKLKEKGIEVVFDKEEFDRILLRENNLQKMSEKLTEAQRRRYFTFDEEDTKKFEEHIKEWQKENTNPSKLIVVGKITPVMKILGISEKLIEVEQSTLDKMIRDVPIYPNDKQGHKLSVDDIYAIPSQLADPVMVFKSRTRNDSFVFFTERKAPGNHSILIPLAVDKRKGRIVIHEITSMYGKDNEIDFVKTNIDENNLVYEDRKRSCLWAKEKIEELENQNIKDDEKNKSSNGGRFTQIQFLGQRFTDNGTYTFNILTKERLVNFISANSKKRTPVQKMSLSSTEPYNIESLFISKNEANLNSEIDKLTEKDVNIWNDYISISSKTPYIYKQFGLDDYPVNMYKQKLARALFLEKEKFGERLTHGHKGEFTSEDVKNVFKDIGNPRYIFNSKQDLNNPDNFYLIGVYDEMDEQGNPMMLSLHFDKNRKQVEANWVTSVYGKNKAILLNDWVKKGYLVYENDIEMEKASEEVVALYMRVSNLQKPYEDNIKRKSDYVNDLLFPKRNENVYGFTYEGKIYLNPDLLGAESAVHEYTHLWDNLTRKDNLELWNKGLKIFKGTSLWNEVINDSHYQDIKDDENLVLSECHARICGRVADSVLNHIAELDGNEKQAEMIDWDKETIDFIFENYRDAIQPEETKAALIEAGISKEDLYSNAEAMSLSDESKNTILSASSAGRGDLTQKAFAENGIEIDIVTANALENCFSQIETITKYTADGHDLFNKGNGIDTISEHSIEYSEKDKVWFVHEKNWLALSAIKGEETGPDDYMEKADRVGDRNWAISCEELVKYVYNEIKEDGEMEKEFPGIFKKLENLKDYTESLTEAKQLISDFCFEEYMSTPIFDDLKNVGLAYTTFEDPYTHEEYEGQTSADLVNCKITTKVNDKIADVSEYYNLKDMIVNSLNNLDFDSLIYVPSSKIDELLKEEREGIEKNLLEKADQIIAETFDEPSLAKKAKLYVPSNYGYEEDNKIHILVEFDNNAEREEDLFNALAERHLILPNGREVDFNPIKPEKSGTIEQYLESLERIKENRYQSRKENNLANIIVTTDNFREVFNEVSKLQKFKDKPLEAAGWCFARVPKENREEVGKWLSDLGCGTKKDSEKLFSKWNNENTPKANVNKSKNKSNEVGDWSISD